MLLALALLLDVGPPPPAELRRVLQLGSFEREHGALVRGLRPREGQRVHVFRDGIRLGSIDFCYALGDPSRGELPIWVIRVVLPLSTADLRAGDHLFPCR